MKSAVEIERSIGQNPDIFCDKYEPNGLSVVLVLYYCKRGNFRMGVIFTFFALLSFSRKLPPCVNNTHMPL